jgi:uncharacterized membrane protein
VTQVFKRTALWLLAAFFVVAGVNHFANPDFYVRIMPPYLPAHRELVVLSGVFEVLGGLGVLMPTSRGLAGWGLILLLLAVFPANIHMALHPEQFASIPVFALYARLPLQIVFIAWTYWATRPDAADAPEGQ